MTLPGSGTITLQDIATELGVSLPLDLNASNVRTLAGVASGNITMPNDFWGKSNADLIPAAMSWADITSSDDGSGAGLSTYVENTNQTLSSINTAITLQISVPSFEVNCSGATPNISASLDIIKNGTVAATLNKSRFGTGTTTSSASTTISVSSGDTLRFAIYSTVAGGVGGSSGGGNGTVSVINQSSSNTVLDTFVFVTSCANDGIE